MDILPEVDDPSYSCINQREMSSLEELTSQHIAAALVDEFQSSFSSGSYTSYPTFTSYGRTEGKTFSCSSVETSGADQVSTAAPDVSSPTILSFGNRPVVGGFAASPPPVKPKEEAGFTITRGSKRTYETMVTQGAKKVNGGTRPPSQAQDHIIAERKRREKLSQKFIALSAIVPGLKKVFFSPIRLFVALILLRLASFLADDRNVKAAQSLTWPYKTSLDRK